MLDAHLCRSVAPQSPSHVWQVTHAVNALERARKAKMDKMDKLESLSEGFQTLQARRNLHTLTHCVDGTPLSSLHNNESAAVLHGYSYSDTAWI